MRACIGHKDRTINTRQDVVETGIKGNVSGVAAMILTITLSAFLIVGLVKLKKRKSFP